MKQLPALAASFAPLAIGLALAGVSGCRSAQQNNHWHVDNVGTRVSYQMTGDLLANDRRWREEASEDGGAFALTLRRHFLNDDPNNPLLPSTVRRVPPPQPPEGEFEVGP